MKKEPKIALVHDFLNQFGGAERVLIELCKIYPAAPLFTLMSQEKIIKKFFPNQEIRTSFIDHFPNFLRRRSKYLLPFLPAAIESFDLKEFDIIISDSNSFAQGIITRPGSVHICYCHSPARYLWDWNQEYLEENKIRGFKKLIVLLILNWVRVWNSFSAKRVDKWLANSKNVAARIKKYFKAEAEVIYPPIDTSCFKIGKPSDYFLIVSRLEPYKKIDLAIRAFNALNLPLIIIGTGSAEKYLKKIARSNIKFLGFLEDEMVKEFLSGCRALVFPGEEDFGIVPVEAMASGRPVIGYGKGGLLETVIPGKTGILFEKPKVSFIIDAIRDFLKIEEKFDPKFIRIHAENFDKKKFIQKMKEVVEAVTFGKR